MITFKYPVNYIYISQEFSSSHKGLDLGWSSSHGGKNQPVYATASGKVVQVVDNDKTGKSWGNLVKIQHDKNLYSLVGHLRDGVIVKVGQEVKQGDLLGYMGCTGKAYGNHTHFEIYDGGASTSYRVDPLPLTYVYPDQLVSDSSKDKVKYLDPTDYKKLYEEEKAKNTILQNKIDEAIKVLNG